VAAGRDDIEHLLAAAGRDAADLHPPGHNHIHHLGRVALELQGRSGRPLQGHGDRGEGLDGRLVELGAETDLAQDAGITDHRARWI
jgi:hypothetical protein